MDQLRTSAPTPERDKIQALEGVRALMAWWVVVGHIAHTIGVIPIPLVEWFAKNNQLAVDVFIILSGFVIARLIDFKRESYGLYLLRRAFRIFPLYICVLLVSAILLPYYFQAMADVPFQTDSNINRLAQAKTALENLPEHLLIHIPLLQGLFPRNLVHDVAYTIVGQAWSISLEFQYYLIAPLIMLAIARPKLLPLMLIAVLGIIAVPKMTGAFLGHQIILFLIGIACFGYSKANRRIEQRLWLIAVGGFIAYVVLRQGHSKIVPIGMWMIVFLSTMPRQFTGLRSLNWLLSSRLLVYLGERSYSTYLVHMIPLYMGVFALNWLDLPRPSYAITLSVLTVAVTHCLSVITFWFIERPGIRIGAVLASTLALRSSGWSAVRRSIVTPTETKASLARRRGDDVF